jgi:hypothetical protein
MRTMLFEWNPHALARADPASPIADPCFRRQRKLQAQFQELTVESGLINPVMAQVEAALSRRLYHSAARNPVAY